MQVNPLFHGMLQTRTIMDNNHNFIMPWVDGKYVKYGWDLTRGPRVPTSGTRYHIGDRHYDTSSSSIEPPRDDYLPARRFIGHRDRNSMTTKQRRELNAMRRYYAPRLRQSRSQREYNRLLRAYEQRRKFFERNPHLFSDE
jgi:hypothetical protein